MVVAGAALALGAERPGDGSLTYEQLEAELQTVTRGHFVAVSEEQRASEAWQRAQAQQEEQRALLGPWWARREWFQTRERALKQFLETEARLQLADDIRTLEADLRRKQALREAVGTGAAEPPLERQERAVLGFLTTAVADAQRDLPGLRPAFVPAGTTVAAFHAAFQREQETFEAQIKPLEDELARRAQALAIARSTKEAQAQRVAEGAQRYWKLRSELHRRFAPAYLAEVKLIAPLDPRPAERTYYHARVEEDPSATELTAILQELTEQLPTVDQQVANAHATFLLTERRFKETADRWQKKNDAYWWFTLGQYGLNGILEVADAAFGIWVEGGAPSAILFELAWRVKEATNPGNFRIPEPTLTEELFALRQRAADALQASQQAGGASAPSAAAAAEEIRRTRTRHEAVAVSVPDVLKNQGDEFQKGKWGAGFGLLAFQMAEAAVRLGERQTGASYAAAMFFSSLHPELTYDACRKLTADAGLTQLQAVQAALQTATPDRADNLLKKLRQPETYDSLVLGFLRGAAVTAGKDVIKNGVGAAQVRANLMAEMAVLDVMWYARLVEYRAAGHYYRQCERMRREFQATIGRVAAQRDAVLSRSRRVLVNKPFATADRIVAEVRFTAPVRDVAVEAGDKRQAVSSIDPGTNTTFSLPLTCNFEAAGEFVLSVQARSARSPLQAMRLDANPLTVARYTGSTLEQPTDGVPLWGEVEFGPDRQHALRAESRELRLVDPPGARPYVPGDWVAVSFRHPGSLPFHRLRLVARMAEGVGEPLELPATAEGRIQYRLPEPPGENILGLVRGPAEDRASRVAGEEVRLTTVAPARRDLPGAPFVKLTQSDLPSRGEWLLPRERAMTAGKGRLLFERRNAAAQLITPKATFYAAGTRNAVGETWENEVDLAPGNYRVEFFYTPPVVRDVTVTAGATTHVEAGSGYGRLHFHRTDALGKVIAPKVTISLAGAKTPLVKTWDTEIDVPAGSYDLEFFYTGGIEVKAVSVAAGKLTRVEVGGYGRLDIDVVDQAGNSFAAKRRLYRPGAKEPTYEGWDRLVDVAPGTWELRWMSGEEEASMFVAVTPGRVTSYRVRAKRN